MKAQEIRDMSDEQIHQEMAALERRVFDLRTQAATEELGVPSELRTARRDIARMRTILRQRELTPQNDAGEEKATV